MQQASDVASYPILCGIFEISLLVSGQTVLATSLQDFKTALRGPAVNIQQSFEASSRFTIVRLLARDPRRTMRTWEFVLASEAPLVDPSKPSWMFPAEIYVYTNR